MKVTFRSLSLEIDTPVYNLRNKEFKKVILQFIDGESLVFCDETEKEFYSISSHVITEDTVIDLHKNYIEFTANGELRIIPYDSILRWKLCY